MSLLTTLTKSKVVTKSIKWVTKNAPKVLTGISIASSIAASGFAIKGTILAVEIEKARREKIEKGEFPQPAHPKWETVKAVWKCYIPMVTCLIVSVGTSVSGIEMSTARTALATTACKLTETAFTDYRNEVINQIGEDKEKEIRNNIAQKNAETPVQQQAPTTLVISPYDKILFYETLTGQIFTSDVTTVKDAFNKINYGLSHNYCDYISVMEYLGELGIDSHDEARGWNVTDGLLEPKMELDTTPDGRPCLRLSTTVPPREGYNMYY